MHLDHDHVGGHCHDHHEHHHEHHHDHHHEDGEECCCGHDHEHEHHHEDGEECCCGHDHHHDHHHHADDVFTSWGVETPHKYTEDDINNALKTLSETEECGVILRAKGIVPAVEGQWIHFDMTPGEYEVRRGDSDYTGKLCVIGTNLDEDKIKSLFNI